MKPLTQRDRRALIVLAVAATVFAAVWFWPQPAADSAAVKQGVAQAERRLTRLRRLAAAVPAREQIDQRVSAELARRETGLINAETAPQAQAQLLQIVRRVAGAQSPPLDIKGSEFSPVQPFGDAYGEVTVSIATDSGIEQILNFIADLSKQPELIATSNLQFRQAVPKKKTVPVRLTISGIVPRKLVPQKKGVLTF